jgi:uncharacterized protein YjbI with pentapeptide repeats
MADETHVAALKQGAAAWNAWRAAHRDARPDLSGASLRGLDLSGADLTHADLTGADLRGTILSRASLSGADLSGANCFKAMLNGADFGQARLSGVQFLTCAQLVAARNWQSAVRDADLACGAPLPPAPA